MKRFIRALLVAPIAFASCAAFIPVSRAGYPGPSAPGARPAVPVVRFSAPESVVPEWMPLAGGVHWFPFAVGRPRLEAYAVRVDLAAPGVSVVVTEGSGIPAETVSRKTSSFLTESGSVAAVNANPFEPSSSTEGERRLVVGLSVSEGRIVSPPDPRYAALAFRSGRASVLRQTEFDPSAVPEHAVGGFFVVLEKAVPAGNPDRRFPRTAAGVSRDGATLYLLVVDGRRLGSVGATEVESGLLLARLGAFDGLILDGGGSSALALRGAHGEAVVVSTPMHGVRRGVERAVGNSLGIRAEK